MDENLYEPFTAFLSPSFTQKFLQNRYCRNGVDQPKIKSYRNSDSLIYYLEHGKRHYDLARFAPLELQPLLLFYGLTQWLKACLLTVDPDYPETAAVLAHGVSSRKRKKQHYAFLDDVVRVQKNGLAVQVATKLFQLPPLEGTSFNMKGLLEKIPDLNPIFADLRGRAPFYQVPFKDEKTAQIPSALLDDLHMTLPRFLTFLKQHTGFQGRLSKQTKQTLCLQLDHASQQWPVSYSGLVFLPRDRQHYDGIPEILAHFLLLYNLSMIGRYETAWWSELFHYASGDDLPFIESFLRLTLKKAPQLISSLLRD